MQLDIEEEQVGTVPEDALQGSVIVLAGIADLQFFLMILQFRQQGQAGQAFVLYDDGLESVHVVSILIVRRHPGLEARAGGATLTVGQVRHLLHDGMGVGLVVQIDLLPEYGQPLPGRAFA